MVQSFWVKVYCFFSFLFAFLARTSCHKCVEVQKQNEKTETKKTKKFEKFQDKQTTEKNVKFLVKTNGIKGKFPFRSRRKKKKMVISSF